jgi:hypothetical protein
VNYACVNTPPNLAFKTSRARGIKARDIGRFGVGEMTTLETKATSTNTQTTKPENAQATAAEGSADTAALITEQQVLFASSAALAPAPAKHHNVAYEFVSAVRAMLTRPEKPRATKHYPQRFTYLENSAMSREMDRL